MVVDLAGGGVSDLTDVVDDFDGGVIETDVVFDPADRDVSVFQEAVVDEGDLDELEDDCRALPAGDTETEGEACERISLVRERVIIKKWERQLVWMTLSFGAKPSRPFSNSPEIKDQFQLCFVQVTN